MKKLTDYKRNVYSQFGEDGIIEKILEILKIDKGVCVEVGAWDGLLFSNTANLWKNRGWKAVLFECDEKRFDELVKNTENHHWVFSFWAYVTSQGRYALEHYLWRYGNHRSSGADLLSIDVDGAEYHIFKSLTLRPKIVILEYNQTIPPEMSVISKEGAYFGSSARALVELAEEKGYMLVAMTHTNCIFVDKQYADLFAEYETSFENLFDRSGLTYLITGYDGDYAFSQQPCFGMNLPLSQGNLVRGEVFFESHSHFKVWLNRFKNWINY